MQCPSCSSKNNYYHRFCYYCGKKLDIDLTDDTEVILQDDNNHLEQNNDEEYSIDTYQINKDVNNDIHQTAEGPYQDEPIPSEIESTTDDITADAISSMEEDEFERENYDDCFYQVPLRRYRKEKPPKNYVPFLKISIAIVVLALMFSAIFIVYNRLIKNRPANQTVSDNTIDIDYRVEETLLNGDTARKISIRSTRAQRVTILDYSAPVQDGTAQIIIPDSELYMLYATDDSDEINTSLEAVLKGDGYPDKLQEIKLRFPVPYAPLSIIQPATGQEYTDDRFYTLILEVTPDSRVTIDDNDYTSMLDNNGRLELNLDVPHQEESFFTITISRRGYRNTTRVITIKRRELGFPLEISEPQPISSNNEWVRVSGRTHPEATIKVDMDTRLVPHVDENGDFEIHIRAENIGLSPVTLTASLEDNDDIDIQFIIERIDENVSYTSTAWDGNASYNELKNDPNLHNGRTFLFTGTIHEIIYKGEKNILTLNTSPQSDVENLVYIELFGTLPYNEGHNIRVFGNRWGNHNNIPRLLSNHLYPN